MTAPSTIRTHRPTGDLSPPRTDWRTNAACRHADPDLFFPLPGTRVAPALAYCGACPVVAACLDDALRTGDGGVRGGMTEDARRRLRRERARP